MIIAFIKKEGNKFLALTGNDMNEIRLVKNLLHNKFKIKDLGNLKYFLGLEVAKSKRGLYICQRKYVTDFLKEYGILDANPA